MTMYTLYQIMCMRVVDLSTAIGLFHFVLFGQDYFLMILSLAS